MFFTLNGKTSFNFTLLKPFNCTKNFAKLYSFKHCKHNLINVIQNPIILAFSQGLGLQINLWICGFYEGLSASVVHLACKHCASVV